MEAADPFVAIVAKVCGTQGSLDPVDVINTCVEIGAPHAALVLLEYMLGATSGGKLMGPAPLSPLPPGIGRRLVSLCVIPPETWAREGFPSSMVASKVTVIIAARRQRGSGGEGEGEERPVAYEVEVPRVFGLLLSYRDDDDQVKHVPVVVEYTTTPAGYAAYIAQASVAEKMRKICEERGNTYPPTERVLTEDDVDALERAGHKVKRVHGGARREEEFEF